MYGLLASVVALWIVLTYNRIQRAKQLVDEGWSDIEVQLKRKYDLIPTLVTTVGAYAKHEKNTFTQVTQLRSDAMKTTSREEKAQKDELLKTTITKIFAIAENYPKLMASKNFLELQQQLTETENTIASARKYYNGAVRNFNILIASFPANLLATIFGQHKREFFQ